MLDRQSILHAIDSLVKIIPHEYGKIEIDFDKRTNNLKVQIHTFNRLQNRLIRTTETIK
jgi:hypothetical protein